MLDQSSIMEKKNTNRLLPATTKTLVTESKLKQDAPSFNAKLNRGARRRDGVKLDHSKPSPPVQVRQRAGYDKRPAARGVFEGDGRNQIAKVEEAEIGSAARPGSKKLNMNHLLNFKYDRRDWSKGSFNNWGTDASRHRSIWATRKHKYNKEQFLQANCQFIVREGQDYSVYSVDPDLLVDWEWIEQVCINSHNVPSCPICLYPPVAAKITRCGHIYCWPCILHYLALSDKTWRKCPICFEAIHKTDLKSVVALETRRFCIGHQITMQLMRRARGSVIALPSLRWKEMAGQPFQLDDGQTDACHSKLLVATESQVLVNILNREERELDAALEAESGCPEVCFVESAMQQLKERKINLGKSEEEKLKLTEGKNDELVPSGDEAVLLTEAEDALENRKRQDSESSDYQKDRDSVDLALLVDGGGKGKTFNGKDTYYFYQAADGQHIYMHAMNVHMLIRDYGSLEQCPETIVATIVEKEDISMNEDLRRRLRYLGHLPLTCEFEVVELRLEPPIVSAETIESFAEEIEKRRRRRSRRARDENRRERHLQLEENRRLGKPSPISTRFRLESLRHFPECGPLLADGSEDPASASRSPLVDSPSCSTPSDYMGSPEGNGSGGLSFAQMLRDGKAKPDAWQRPSVNQESNRRGIRLSDSENEEYMPAPAFRDSFCAALQDAFEKTTIASDSTDAAAPVSHCQVSKKKKGKQKKLLFTTSVIRSK